MSVVRREAYKFCQDICIPCYQTNAQSVLKPAAFMDLAQEIAYWAAKELGFGYDTLHIHHTAFPVWGDEVRLYTWHKGANGLFYLRDFDLQDPEGKSLITATSSWVVIDERTRRLVRPEDLQTLLDTEKVDDAIETPAPKVPSPVDPEPAGTHRVAFSDIDILGHTNNARYVVWAMDCIPPEEAERPLKDLYINFNKETRLGDTVELYRLRTAGGWHVEGRLDGKSCFVVKMEY